LRPGNTAFKGQLKLVNGFERYTWIHAFKKKAISLVPDTWDISRFKTVSGLLDHPAYWLKVGPKRVIHRFTEI
jgi:hypothetical protein